MGRAATSMPPPPANAAPSLAREASRVTRPSPPPPQPSVQSQSLFLPQDDDDRQWDPSNYAEDDEQLLWDQGEKNLLTMNSGRPETSDDQGSGINGESDPDPTQRLAPTQRLNTRLTTSEGLGDLLYTVFCF